MRAPQLAVLRVERLEHLADGGALGLGRDGAAGRVAQLRGQLHGDRHQTATPGSEDARSSGSTAASKASTVGSMSATSNVPRTASMVFSPSPVM